MHSFFYSAWIVSPYHLHFFHEFSPIIMLSFGIHYIEFHSLTAFLFLRHLKANFSTSKNPSFGKKITISVRNKDVSLQVSIGSKHPHLEGSHYEAHMAGASIQGSKKL